MVFEKHLIAVAEVYNSTEKGDREQDSEREIIQTRASGGP